MRSRLCQPLSATWRLPAEQARRDSVRGWPRVETQAASSSTSAGETAVLDQVIAMAVMAHMGANVVQQGAYRVGLSSGPGRESAACDQTS